MFADGPINRRKSLSNRIESGRKRCESEVLLTGQWSVSKFSGKVPDPGRKSCLNPTGEVISLGWLLRCRFPIDVSFLRDHRFGRLVGTNTIVSSVGITPTPPRSSVGVFCCENE